jgi:hypothetical protein
MITERVQYYSARIHSPRFSVRVGAPNLLSNEVEVGYNPRAKIS